MFTGTGRRAESALGRSVLASVLLAGCGGGGYEQMTPYERHLYLEPTDVATSRSYDRVAMGHDFSCMLTANGEAWCWGSNEYGKLGAATSGVCAGGNVPCSWQAVRAGAPQLWASLSPGERHSCGLDSAGQAWCWGFGLGGQLGDGAATSGVAPTAVAGGHRFVQIDAGRSALLSCALDDAGAAWCWGAGDLGGLGNGTTDSSNVPVKVLSPQVFKEVGAGDGHACALDLAGQAWCWGRNGHGKLGLGVSGIVLVPAPVAGGHRFRSLAVGGQFNCALTLAGQAWCWGNALNIGDGMAVDRDVPTAVAGGHVFAGLSASYGHTCGLKADGSAWCWGNVWALGSGNEDQGYLPVEVVGGHQFRTVKAGGTATCGITTAGVPMCWGGNSRGEVGQSNVDR